MKKAQSSTVIIMLVGSVFAVALLSLVIAINDSLTPPISGYEATNNLILQASKSKAGLCFGWEKVPFAEGEIWLERLLEDADVTGHTHTPAVKCNSEKCVVEHEVSIKISAKCSYLGSSGLECGVFFANKNCEEP